MRGQYYMDEIRFTAIGIVRSPFKEPAGTPIQPRAARGVEGSVEVFPEYAEGLRDLDGFSHIILLCYLHLARPFSLRVQPYLETTTRGLFATRSPSRPNPIGLSIVRLVRMEGTTLHVKDVDLIDGSPVLDIKPYVPRFDDGEDVRVGWLAARLRRLEETRDDGRFAQHTGKEED